MVFPQRCRLVTVKKPQLLRRDFSCYHRGMEKNFDRWNEKKKKLDAVERHPSYASEREIWWCSLGVNIGREQNGQGDSFERPVVILKALSPDTFMALPLSTKKRVERFQSVITHGSMRGFALLDQVRVLDTKRLRRKIGTADQCEFAIIKEKLKGIF